MIAVEYHWRDVNGLQKFLLLAGEPSVVHDAVRELDRLHEDSTASLLRDVVDVDGSLAADILAWLETRRKISDQGVVGG